MGQSFNTEQKKGDIHMGQKLTFFIIYISTLFTEELFSSMGAKLVSNCKKRKRVKCKINRAWCFSNELRVGKV